MTSGEHQEVDLFGFSKQWFLPKFSGKSSLQDRWYKPNVVVSRHIIIWNVVDVIRVIYTGVLLILSWLKPLLFCMRISDCRVPNTLRTVPSCWVWDTAYCKTVSHSEETTTRNEEMTLWRNRTTETVKPHHIMVKPHHIVVKPHHIVVKSHHITVKPHHIMMKPNHKTIKPHQVILKPHYIMKNDHIRKLWLTIQLDSNILLWPSLSIVFLSFSNSFIIHAVLTQPEHVILVRWMDLET